MIIPDQYVRSKIRHVVSRTAVIGIELDELPKCMQHVSGTALIAFKSAQIGFVISSRLTYPTLKGYEL